jgi:hypothetical protein
MNMTTRYLEITFIIIAIFALSMYSIKEAFTTQTGSSYGVYPSKLLLTDWYPLHKPTPSVSDLESSDQYVNYPIFNARSVHINNLRQWRKPNNGTCSRAEMCGDVYDYRKVTLPTEAEMPGFNKGIRVNYYNLC